MPIAPEEMRIVHHEYLVDLERRGILFAAGPFVDETGKRHGAGMLIIRVKNRAEAEAIAFGEPYTKAGQRVMELTPWQRNEGAMTMQVHFADGVLEMESRRYRLPPLTIAVRRTSPYIKNCQYVFGLTKLGKKRLQDLGDGRNRSNAGSIISG